MSRIYEALQKAESERAAERAPEREPVASPPSVNGNMHAAAAVAVPEYATTTPAQQAEVVGMPTTQTARDAAGGLEGGLGEIARHRWSPALVQLPALLQRGPAVEQFRSLRSRIFEMRDIRPLKSILVTSGMPQEGKSFISINLAMSLARHKNSRVLLIDGDMRRFTLHHVLGCESQPGLAEYLAGKASLQEVMQRGEASAPGQPVLPNLTFIPGGNGGDRAADLSGSPRFGELLQSASSFFDWIVVDSSPVLPVSDAVNLARFCDGVLLVAREGVTKYPVAQRAQSELKTANILGFVLNAVHEAPQVGDYYGYDASQD